VEYSFCINNQKTTATDNSLDDPASSSITLPAYAMSAPTQPMTDFTGLEPLLVYRQEGGCRAPRLAPWNATSSRILPIPLFSFPSQPSSCAPRDETFASDLNPGCQAAGPAYIPHYEGHGPASTAGTGSGGSSVQEQPHQHNPSIQEMNPKDPLSSSSRSSGISPGKKKERKRVSADASPSKRTKAKDDRCPPPMHNGEQKAAEVGLTLPSPPNSLSRRGPSFSPLTPQSSSSKDLSVNFSVDLPIDFHEDPWHYDPQDHRLALEIKRLRLWNWSRRNQKATGGLAQKVPSNKAAPKSKDVSTAIAQEASNVNGLADVTDDAEYASEVDEWGIRKMCHFR